MRAQTRAATFPWSDRRPARREAHFGPVGSHGPLGPEGPFGESVSRLIAREARWRGKWALTADRLDSWNRKALQWFDRLPLEVRDEQGRLVAGSDTREGPNWVQLKVPTGKTLQVTVRLGHRVGRGAGHYRLFATGAGSTFGGDQSATPKS